MADTIRRVSTDDDLTSRLLEVSAWYEEGGVLLMSYDIFRSWINNRETKKRPPPLSDSVHQKVKLWLLEGPNIIVADEAHKMKNPKSALFEAAMQFRSRSRIALTGSPLANNLQDYFVMVNWIAEGYLGESVQFRAHYIEPIEQGLYTDSSYWEKRRSLKQLALLKQILEPKINRADIAVLGQDLPPKVEFILTVPLTELQKNAYDAYTSLVLQGQTGEIKQTTLWSWLGILGQCCNHPDCFRERLISRAQGGAKSLGKASMNSSEAQPGSPEYGDQPIDTVGLPNLDSVVNEQLRLFDQVHDMKSVELSARAEIASSLIDESIKAGDKVLVFSQSLPSLDYLGHVLQVTKRRFVRLDGRTSIPSRQAATKQFNQGNQEQVYLISTRAGGLGLNIQGANRVIIWDFSFNPIWEEQAVGRVYRLGQPKPVFVYRFLAGGTFEEIIHHKTIFKTQLAARVVDKRNVARSAQKKPGDYLFPAREVPQEDVSGYIGKDKQVLDKILREDTKRGLGNRLIRNIKLTQTFQTEDNDELTEEEKQSVQADFEIEHLRRTDPDAYERKQQEARLRQLNQGFLQQSTPVSVGHGTFYPSFHDPGTYGGPSNVQLDGGMYSAQQVMQRLIPPNAHNSGPPALAPDMISQVAAPNISQEPGTHNQLPVGNSLPQRPVNAQGTTQPLENESYDQAQPIRRPDMPPSQPPASLPFLKETNSSNRVESEPPKPFLTAVSASNSETHSSRGKSMPPQNEDQSLEDPGSQNQGTSAEPTPSSAQDAQKSRSSCNQQ